MRNELFPETIESIFVKLGLPGFEKEIQGAEDTFGTYMTRRITFNDFPLLEEENLIKRQDYPKYVRYLGRLKQKGFWREWEKLEGYKLLEEDSHNQNCLLIMKSIERVIKTQANPKEEVDEQNKRFLNKGKVHISPATTIKSNFDLNKFINKNPSSITDMPQNPMFYVLEQKMKAFQTLYPPFEKLLFFLKDSYRDRFIEKKGMKVFDLNVKAQIEYNITDPRTGKTQTIKDVDSKVEYALFVFAHNESKRGSDYKELLSLMHTKNNSWARRAEGEKEALMRLRDISVGCSDISEIVHFVTRENKMINHLDFNSTIKFFFITEAGLRGNVKQYVDSINGYFGDKLGPKIWENLKNSYIAKGEQNKLVPELDPSQQIMQEFESEAPLLGERLILLTVPKFMITEDVTYRELNKFTGNFIAQVNDLDIVEKNKIYAKMMNDPKIKDLTQKRKRPAILEVFACFNMIFHHFLLISGGTTKNISDTVDEAMISQGLHKILRTKVNAVKNTNADRQLFRRSEFDTVREILISHVVLLLGGLNNIDYRFRITGEGRNRQAEKVQQRKASFEKEQQ